MQRPVWLALLYSVLLSTAVLAREWQDTTGKFNIAADLLRVAEDQAELRKPDGTIIKVPLAKLSKADREFITDQSSVVWLSDLPEKNVRVAYGSFGKQGNLGYDDAKIKVRDQTFPHGLSMHPATDGAHAHVQYQLDRKYRTLRGSVAMNDSSTKGSDTPVIFLIRGRQKKAFPAPELADTIRIELEVDGHDTVIVRAHDCELAHHAGAIPPTVSVDDKPFDPRAHAHQPLDLPVLHGLDLSAIKHTKIQGRGEVKFKASEQQLEIDIRDAEPGADQYVIDLKVGEADGIFQLWSSHPLFHRTHRQDFVVDVTDIDELHLEVYCDQSLPNRKGNAHSHAVWLEPQLSTLPPPTEPLRAPGAWSTLEAGQVLRYKQKIAALLKNKKFDDLNRELAAAKKSVRPPRHAMQTTFYDALSRPKVQGADAWEEHLSLLRTWREHSPKAAAPAVALSNAMTHQAIYELNPLPNVVPSPESEAAYSKQILAAEEVAHAATKLADVDGEAWITLMTEVTLRNAAEAELPDLLYAGLRVDPQCWQLYATAGRFLTRKGGNVSKEVCPRVAEEVRSRLGGEAGDRAYAEMCLAAAAAQSNRYVREIGFGYDKLKPAILPLVRERLAERDAAPVFLELALRAGDLQTAWTLMPHCNYRALTIQNWEQAELYFAWINYANRYRVEPQWKASFRANDYYLTDMQWTDENTLITVGNYNGIVKRWKLTDKGEARGEDVYTFEFRGNIAAVDPKQKYAVGTVIWDTETKYMRVYDLEKKAVAHDIHTGRYLNALVKSSPFGDAFVSSSLASLVQVHSLAKLEEPLAKITVPSLPISIAFSPDRKTLALLLYNGEAIVWDTTNPKRIVTRVRKARDGEQLSNRGEILYSPSGRYLAFVDNYGEVFLADLETRKGTFSYITNHRLSSLVFMPDEQHLAIGCATGVIKFMSLKTGTVIDLEGHWSEVPLLRLSPDGQRFASGAIDGTIAVWDVAEMVKRLKDSEP